MAIFKQLIHIKLITFIANSANMGLTVGKGNFMYPRCPRQLLDR